MSFTIFLSGIFLLYFVFKGLMIAEKLRKKIQKSKTNITLLKPGKFSATKIFNIGYNTSITELIAENLKECSEIAHLSQTEAIIYSPKTRLPEFKDIMLFKPEKIPIRIVVQIIDRQLKVQLDENYGWQMIYGRALRMFKKNIKELFRIILSLSRKF